MGTLKTLQHLVRRTAILPIRFYRLFISPVLPPACRFEPTCSVYAMEAVLKHGILHGGWLAVRRIFRCHPWCAGGFDPVPPCKGPFGSADTPPPNPDPLSGTATPVQPPPLQQPQQEHPENHGR